MFASLVGLGALLGLTVVNLLILAQVKWNKFHLALDYDSIENDLAHLRFPGMKVKSLGLVFFEFKIFGISRLCFCSYRCDPCL